MPANKLLNALSFTHLEQMLAIDDPLKRAFYKIECIRGNWSVRSLKRQIATLYFERSGLSKDKEKRAEMVHKGIEAAEPQFAIRDPYIFEFLGLRAKDAVAESDLEAVLVENLRAFLLELGHGFCLEAQQKSIVIGKTRGFVDLVIRLQGRCGRKCPLSGIGSGTAVSPAARRAEPADQSVQTEAIRAAYAQYA